MIEQLIKENPSFPYQSNNKKLFKEAQISWSRLSQTQKTLVTQQRVDSIAVYRKKRLELLSGIILQNRIPTDLEPDSDDDCYDM
jgi:cell division protein FtsL